MNTATPARESKFFVVSGYKPVGSSDNGICERCGTLCPRQTVIMAAVGADGLVNENIYAHWGVCCAAQYCYGTKTAKNRDRVLSDVRRYEEYRAHEIESWNRRIATDKTSVWVETVRMGVHATRTESHIQEHNSIREAANVKFMRTGLRPPGSFLMANTEGHEVRVMPSRLGEVEYYTSIGFVQATAIVQVTES